MDFESREEQQEFGECEPEGVPVFVDLDGTKFFSGVKVHNLRVRIGDTVRIKLEIVDDEDDEDTFAFAQVLAIYDDDRPDGEGVHVEARWYILPIELQAKRRKLFDALENELIESDDLDDVPAGAIIDHIIVREAADKGSSASSSSSSSASAREADSHFVCRYLSPKAALSSSFQHVSQSTALRRGMAFSSYQHAYLDHMAAMRGSGGGRGKASGSGVVDVYSNAIRKLHVSVVPDVLPCRTEERSKIHHILREAVSSRCSGPPMYISGMPGTGKTATLKVSLPPLHLSRVTSAASSAQHSAVPSTRVSLRPVQILSSLRPGVRAVPREGGGSRQPASLPVHRDQLPQAARCYACMSSFPLMLPPLPVCALLCTFSFSDSNALAWLLQSNH